MAEDKVIITLEFDDDTTEECELMGTFDVEDKTYAALAPEDKSEVYLYRVDVDEDGNMSLGEIEDDDEYDKVSDAFDEIVAGAEEIAED